MRQEYGIPVASPESAASPCIRRREWLSQAYDGELPLGQLALLEAHLPRCAGCRRFAAEIGYIATLIATTSPRAARGETKETVSAERR